MSWAIGRETILAMLDAGDLEQVAPNAEFAQALIDKARKHLATADLLCDTDLEIAFDALYTAARLSVTALLATQGLRPTTKGATSLRSKRCELNSGSTRRCSGRTTAFG